MKNRCNFKNEDSNTVLSLRDKIKTTEVKGNQIINTYQDHSIRGKSVQCKLFRNTWIVYYDLSITGSEILPFEENGEIRINYCISGRCELLHQNNKVIYLGNGDFITVLLDDRQYKHDFPLGTYKGLSIVTTLQSLDIFLKKIFNETKITGDAFIKQLKTHNSYLLLSNNGSIKRIMEEITYSKDDYLKEKSLIALSQLIVFLLSNDLELNNRRDKYVDIKLSNKVKYIQKEVTSNIEDYVTVNEISKKYGLSPRAFSECFREIYGKTYYAFIKDYRMKKAAELLILRKESITEIALSVGYKNPGKFSKAFCDIFGVTPLQFRKNSMTGLD